ncbi:SagB-type dehydrogenase family enzyme [Dysgonomonas sp. PFB1-18]|uniref:SagB/ThcOx family dehydrogenase n=1 Tax=unclassified Dysgonomonas TaxID=2630389 RepID=UPI002473A77F|nr:MULTISPECIES: SagB/ThcOx family dehydrogenase [unclassified Dysgonomonas]MDH6308801.1 SagB-type dehydrogenase family enzyme [Dysgonomonas sp. PF1-14]MDH6338502.1 SagB-type dehydrogenase family enzyme [Dysgonomonas sp. PF1-16]MDH6380050.1 SagB-type dehydrogenase family enzyme [Dysgonomonas sp. PFB1-18]MDH6397330.1 SagB-type dehydrogenase family enzyme [Dysgonomonas sp. PF1-23]
MKKGLLTILFLSFIACLSAQDIQLVPPTKTGGKPLMEALNERQSNRNFEKKDLPAQTLSDLLWAAYGFNREDKRTVPSSQNKQEVDVYVMFSNGIYFYDAKANKLVLKEAGDFRQALGQPAISDNASLSLIYVINLDKNSRDAGLMDAGFSVQNVYLYCASAGLGSVARGSFKRPDVHNVLKLTEKQEVVLVQAVGYVK